MRHCYFIFNALGKVSLRKYNLFLLIAATTVFGGCGEKTIIENADNISLAGEVVNIDDTEDTNASGEEAPFTAPSSEDTEPPEFEANIFSSSGDLLEHCLPADQIFQATQLPENCWYKDISACEAVQLYTKGEKLIFNKLPFYSASDSSAFPYRCEKKRASGQVEISVCKPAKVSGTLDIDNCDDNALQTFSFDPTDGTILLESSTDDSYGETQSRAIARDSAFEPLLLPQQQQNSVATHCLPEGKFKTKVKNAVPMVRVEPNPDGSYPEIEKVSSTFSAKNGSVSRYTGGDVVRSSSYECTHVDSDNLRYEFTTCSYRHNSAFALAACPERALIRWTYLADKDELFPHNIITEEPGLSYFLTD